MYKIPLTNSPNQRFQCNIPVNGENILFQFDLWFNYQAKYWLMTLTDVRNKKEIFSNLPLLCSNGEYYNMLSQLSYKGIGVCIILPIIEEEKSMPDEKDIGRSYVMIWGDN